DPAGPWPCGIDHRRRRDLAAGGAEAEAAGAVALDGEDLGAVPDLRPGARRLPQEEVAEPAGIDEAVSRAEGPAGDPPREPRRLRADVRLVEPLHGDAALALPRRRGLHRPQLRRIAGDEEIARLV